MAEAQALGAGVEMLRKVYAAFRDGLVRGMEIRS